jgi:lipoprotein-anchoring transpeptidase ErfK/SrfK
VPCRVPVLILTLGLASCGSPPGETPTHKSDFEIVELPTEEEIAARRAEAERLAREAEEAERHAEAARIRAAEEARIAAERAAFEAAYPLHGVVYHFIAQVFERPDDDHPIGYMRRGSQFRAKRAVSGPGCGSWHEVPGGGFVCAGKGFLIGETPQTFEPSPRPPALDDALPYNYAYTMRDVVPQYWRLPTMEEELFSEGVLRELAERERRRAELAEEQAAAALAAATTAGSDAGVADTDGDQLAEGAEARADAVEAPPPPGSEAEEGTIEAETDEGEEDDGLPDYLRTRMLRGFYVSVDREESTEAGRRFYRTIRGGYVRATELRPNEPPESRGVVLGGAWQLPVAIVWRNGPHQYRRVPATGRLVDRGTIDRHTALRVADDRLVHDDRVYVVDRDGVIVREPAVRIIRQRDVPPGVPRDAKWIHVDLSEQYLVAYEGESPVFATLVSTGKEGFETPTGLFRIQSKHVSTTMDDTESPEGAYSIEDVPWTMYFHGNFAIHGAFWHYTFGRVRSHGCVNLSPADARWVFSWSTPTLPAAWHGMFAGPRDGTFVFIEE